MLPAGVILLLVIVVLMLAETSAGAGESVPMSFDPLPPVTPDQPASPSALAQAIAVAEGFGTPGAIPTVRHNPGDLTNSDGSIRTFATDADGWAALEHQLMLIGSGASRYYRPDMTIAEMAPVWTKTQVTDWANNVARELGVSVDTPITGYLP